MAKRVLPQSPNEVADYLANLLKKPPPKASYTTAKPRPKRKVTPLQRSIKRQEQPIAALGPETVTLLARHCVNGMLYGPGRVTVPHDLACALREGDQRARQYDDTWRQEKARIIGGKGDKGEGTYKATSVHPSVFTQAMDSGPGLGEITGNEANNFRPIAED